ncbi:MAG TPA: hypothetical protein VGD38_10325, partial [Pyrinomonadaceae bacterium]
RLLDDVGCRDVHTMSLAFRRRREVLRALRQHDVSARCRRITNTTANCGARERRHLLALRAHIRGSHKILRPLRYTVRKSGARMARAKAGGSPLPDV